MLARTFILLALMFGGIPAFAIPEEQPYLYDLLTEDSYLAAWNAMLAGAAVPAWVANYANGFDGPTSPSSDIAIGGEAYTLGWVCKAHDCGDNQLYVLFAPDASRAWALLITGGDQRQWLGAPDAAIQEAILSGVQ